MSVNIRALTLAGAVGLALGGPAMANTNLDAGTTGDVFINVVDSTNNTSFLYDTGDTTAQFLALAATPGTTTFNFSTDANYEAFVTGQGTGDVIDYSVLSSTKTTATPAVGTVLFTSNSTPGAVIGQFIANANTNIGAFLGLANAVTSATANSALLGSTNTWGQTAYEYTVATNLGVPFTSVPSGVDALVGTSINFYEEVSNALRSASTYSTLSTLAGIWTESGGIASYTVAGSAPVPLPTPVLLLLSGLGLMGVVARRGKSAVTAA
jgi:hypothetical protein